MIRTNKLRFVERGSRTWVVDDYCQVEKVRVLQQWWEPEQNIIDRVAGKTTGEWRDVPLEEEA